MDPKPKKLLVIDWDSFFYNPMEAGDAAEQNFWLYDWGHRENSLFIEGLWTIRAAQFDSYDIARPGTTGHELGFWDRFNIKKSATLYYADSNVLAVNERVRRDVNDVWLYDAHHDCGYSEDYSPENVAKNGRVECGSWMVYYHLSGADLHVRYPRWRTHVFEDEFIPEDMWVDVEFDTDANLPEEEFDRVFVCRSGAWVPSWLDEQFFEFINDWPFRKRVNLDDVKPRVLDEHAVKTYAENTKELREEATK